MSDKREVLNVPRWILDTRFSKKMVDELLKCDLEVVTETEKAVKILFTSEELQHEDWFPKKTREGKDIVVFKK